MRPALMSLVAAALIAGAAQAQPSGSPTPAATPSPPPTATTPTPTTPTAPATPATPAAPAPAPTSPAAGAPPAPVAPTTAPAAPETPAPPAAPPDPLATQVVSALTQICIPATNGGNLDQLARGAGYRRNRDSSYVLRQPTFQITINPLQSGGHTCEAVFEYAVGPIPAVITAVHEWALSQTMTMRDPFRSTTDEQRDVRSWERDADALVLMSEKRLDGRPVAGQRDRSRIIYQRRTS